MSKGGYVYAIGLEHSPLVKIGWTRDTASGACWRESATISELENGTRTTLTTDTAKALARALGVSIDHLVGTWEEQSEDEDEATTVPLVGAKKH